MKSDQPLISRRRFLSWIVGIMLSCAYVPGLLADPAAGKAVFEAKKCGGCHQVTGPVEELPVAERSSIKGPPLWFAGSKFKGEWLTAWLAKPTPIRRVKYGTLDKGSNDHPALSAEDTAQISEYLMSLTDAELKTGIVADKKLSRRTKFKAEKLFAKKQVCFGCHQYPSKQGEIGGFAGPSLVGAGQRLQADWVLNLLKDNLRYYPNGRMPVYGDQAFEPFSDEELQLLAQFIGNL